MKQPVRVGCVVKFGVVENKFLSTRTKVYYLLLARLLVVELVSDSTTLMYHQLHQIIKLEDMSEGVASSEGDNVLHTVSVIRVRLDSHDPFREREQTKHRFQKYCEG